jgi:5-methylcytosine-specific restriction endonuclease McrA
MESYRRVQKNDPTHKERWAHYRKTYRSRHPDRVKASDKKQALRRFGLTPQEYDDMAARQNHSCAVCGEKDTKALAVDHDHDTGRVRGLLCGKCNTALGLMNDSIRRLRLAVDYLEDHSC